MVIDSSAVLAILLAESDATTYSAAIAGAGAPVMSVTTFVELGVVTDRARNPRLDRRLDSLIRESRIELVGVSTSQGLLARAAHRDFGRGSGHPAKLNFGDCFSYALAKDLDLPLLFKGEDFTHTDVRRAI